MYVLNIINSISIIIRMRTKCWDTTCVFCFIFFTVGICVVQCQIVQLCQNCDTTDCPGTSLYNTTAEQCLASLGTNGSMLVSFDQLGTCRLFNNSHCLTRYNDSAEDTSVYGTWSARYTNVTETRTCITSYQHVRIFNNFLHLRL